MKIRLTFSGAGTKHTIIELPLLQQDAPQLKELKQFWEMEQAVNTLTRSRLHIELVEE